ncbi:hypothetical protein IF1G_06847 [Cordyceps javanica]|uniref:Uncharacterized protein n=1 Tax=Cordyceps javanica TaxID=43265 RepID=A0A545UZE7_9HYPO|nr:hypothetical protein IF1G_06847 [Cordyceps javanica]
MGEWLPSSYKRVLLAWSEFRVVRKLLHDHHYGALKHIHLVVFTAIHSKLIIFYVLVSTVVEKGDVPWEGGAETLKIIPEEPTWKPLEGSGAECIFQIAREQCNSISKVP